MVLYVFSDMQQPSTSGSNTNEIPDDLVSLVEDDRFFKNNMDHYLQNTNFSDVLDLE